MAKREILTEEEFWRGYIAHDKNAYAFAQSLGHGHRQVARRAAALNKKYEAIKPELPEFPDDDISVDEIRATLSKRFTARHAHAESKRWFEIKLPEDKPFALMLWGDPHIDSNGCNWPLLEEHCKLAQQPGVWSINIGDTLDNWPHGSRLARLYAHSDQSVETSWKLAKWFLEDSGINWLVIILGNHDLWPGHTNLKHLIKKPLIMEDWGARFLLKTAGQEWKVWAAHDFPGHSQWNSLHGNQKAAHMKETCDLYVSGHTHNWALHQEESASKGFVYWLARARGYKYLDEHATLLGHDPQTEGASVMAVFDPACKTMAGRLQCFSDVHQGADYLAYLRKRK